MPYEFTEPLYHDEARERVVKEDDPAARFLLGVPGQSVSDEEAERLGLPKPRRKAAAEESDTEEAPAGKAVRASDVEDKSVRLGGDAKDKGK